MYIQHIEETYESTSKGKYFLITTKTDYRKVLTEANDMIKYISPDRVTTELKTSIQRTNVPIIHNNVSTYTQALMIFHKSNPVSTQSSINDSKSNSTPTSSMRKETLPKRSYNLSERKTKSKASPSTMLRTNKLLTKTR